MVDHGWTHDGLAADLKAYLEGNKAARMIWLDMQLGPSGSARPDVYALPKSYSRFAPFAYEIKVSRGDFQADINAAKWQKYYQFASAVVFAVPDGLIKTTELPDGAGLIVRKASVWRMAKAPKINHLDNLPRDAWMKLLIDGAGRLSSVRARDNRYYLEQRAWEKALGKDIAKLASNREHAKWQIENEIKAHIDKLAALRAKHEQDRQRAREQEPFAEEKLDRLCDLLGLPKGSPTYRIANAFEAAVRELDADSRISDLVRTIDSAQHALNSAKQRATIKPIGDAA